jgi:hypothetical protein
MPRFKIFLSIIPLLLTFAAVKAAIGQNVYISTFDPINSQIERLLAGGYLRDMRACEKPWSRNDIISSIRTDQEKFDKRSERIAAQILKKLHPPQRKAGISAGFDAGIDLRGRSRENRRGFFIDRGRFVHRDFKNEFGSVFRAGWWISGDDRWGADTRLIVDTDGTEYPWYYGRPRNARTIVQFDHAYGAFEFGPFELMAGRQRMIWGPSPRGSLLLDHGSAPMDMIRLRFDLKPFRLSWFISRIDDYFDLGTGLFNRRYIAGHRLSLKPAGSWEIALSEIVLYGGAGRLPETYYSIPILLYYWEAHNNNVDDNIFWNLDLSWAGKDLGRFYMQFVADDFQYENNGPQKFALQIGSYLMPSRFPEWSALIEINAVDTYVYGQRQRRNAYLNRDDNISRLDSDQLELFAGIYRDISSNARAALEFTRRDKGEYYAAESQPDIIPLDDNFPSGTVETTNNLRLMVELNVIENLDFRVSAGYQSIDNYRHLENSSLDQFYSAADISYSFGSGLPFWTKYR